MTDARLGSSASLSTRSALTRFACEHPLLFATGALLLGGALVVAAFKLLASGDEPPIRVKSGSMVIELLTENDEMWEPETASSRNWKISKGERSKDNLRVIVVTKGGHSGCDDQPATGKSAEVSYTDESDIRTVRLQSTNRHLLVLPQGNTGFTRDVNNHRNLNYDVQNGYISKITVGPGPNPWECTFGEDQLDAIYVLDW